VQYAFGSEVQISSKDFTLNVPVLPSATRFNFDCPMLARFKYLCDYGNDNCNPVLPCVLAHEASEVMLSNSLFFQQAHLWPREKHRTPKQPCCLMPNTPEQ
jgi:hypothetical protein